jgi:two-component sensor histidine kinase
MFGDHHAFTVFYPGVILAAYFLGARPAILTAALSAAVAYWAFGASEFGAEVDFADLTTMLFFALTSTVSIYFITGMRVALTDLAEARARAEKLAASHSDLFRNLSARVTNHLQLVAALLQLQARDERDAAMARALAEASARTLLISRAHRNLDGQIDQTLDFDAFARQLLDAALADQDHPHVQVVIEPSGIQLPLDEATSVAIVLLECLQARLQAREADDGPAILRIGMRRDGRQARLTVAESGARAPSPADRRLYLIEAMVEQLGGRFSSRAGADDIVSELTFPVAAPMMVVARDVGVPRVLH